MSQALGVKQIVIWTWVFGIVALVAQLDAFSVAAGKPVARVMTWPSLSSVAPPKTRPRLVMFVHPQCSCSRASIRELEKLHAQIHNQTEIYVYFYSPDGFAKNWVETDLWHQVEQMSEIHLMKDFDGQEARLFNVKTSGQVFLYSPAGELEFSGGITNSRGHEGDSDGKSAILAYLDRSRSLSPFHFSETKVYGCSILKKSAELTLEGVPL